MFTLRSGFVGTVTITYGDKTVTHTASSDKDRTIIINDISIADITSDITITAEGTIAEASANVTEGKYNLSTFAKYHYDNAQYAENEIPTDSQLASAKILSIIDAIYAYSAAANAAN